MRTWRATRYRRPTALAVLVLLMAVPLAAPSVTAAPGDLTVDASNGEGHIVQPGRPCDDGGDGAYWHYDYGSDLNPGVFSSLPGEVRVHLDLHSDIVRFPNTDGAYEPAPAGPTAFLLGTESHASLLNDRGSLKVRLASGDCDEPTVAFDGSEASVEDGEWEVAEGSGAYEGATGDGGFDLIRAEVNPGADNTLELVFDGDITVRQPSLDVEVITTYWGQLGLDYLTRRPTVVYRITNTGPGDSFGARITSVQSLTAGATLLTPADWTIGFLPAGESVDMELRWQLGLLQPCLLVLLGCRFDSRVTVDFPDALDVPHTFAETVTAQAPLLPPPL